MKNKYSKFLSKDFANRLQNDIDSVDKEITRILTVKGMESFGTFESNTPEYRQALKACVEFMCIKNETGHDPYDWFKAIKLEDYYPFEFNALKTSIESDRGFRINTLIPPTNLLEMYAYVVALASTVDTDYYTKFLNNSDLYTMQDPHHFLFDDLSEVLKHLTIQTMNSNNNPKRRVAISIGIIGAVWGSTGVYGLVSDVFSETTNEMFIKELLYEYDMFLSYIDNCLDTAHIESTIRKALSNFSASLQTV